MRSEQQSCNESNYRSGRFSQAISLIRGIFMQIIIQRILFYEASSKLGKKVTRRVDEKLQRSISCARDDGPRLARLQRGVTSRYASRATFFARSSSNFASILHSAKILDEALPFFHAPSKNRLPPLIRLTRSSGVFHKERNSLFSRVLVTRLTIVVKILPLVYPKTSVLHPYLIQFYAKKSWK